VNVDRKHKLVRRYHVSDAALHDSQAVDHLLMQGNTGSGV
jgi:IS5 family transposase